MSKCEHTDLEKEIAPDGWGRCATCDAATIERLRTQQADRQCDQCERAWQYIDGEDECPWCHITRLWGAVKAVCDLMDESAGVYGLHLNGDPSPWDELRTGGRFEEWLVDFDKTLAEGGE